MRGNKIIVGVVFILAMGFLLYMTYQDAVSITAWRIGVGYTIVWAVISIFIMKYDQKFIRKLVIGFSVTFFYILLMNRLLLTNISYIQPLLMFLVLSITAMRNKWREYKNNKQLLSFLLFWIIFVPSLFVLFDQRVTVVGQMKDDVRDYIRKTEEFNISNVKSIDVVNVSVIDTFAIVKFNDDPDNEYIYVDNGSGVDFTRKREARSYK